MTKQFGYMQSDLSFVSLLSEDSSVHRFPFVIYHTYIPKEFQVANRFYLRLCKTDVWTF